MTSFKIHGYHHNLNRRNNNLDNIDLNNSSLSSQPNVPSSSSPRSSITSTTSNVLATSAHPTPSTTTLSNLSTQGNPTSSNTSNQHTCRAPLDKWVINLSNTPLSSNQLTLLQKGYVKEETYKFSSKGPTPSGPPLSTPRTKTTKQNKQESFIITSAHTYNVPAHT